MPVNPFNRLSSIYTDAFSSKPLNFRWIKDDLLDTLHWLRQAIAVVLGLLWGGLGITGAYAFAGHLAVGTLAIFAWYKRQRIDEEDYGGHQALLTEGIAPSISLFMVSDG